MLLKRSVILFVGFFASACVSSAPRLKKEESSIRIYSTAPTCKYENLGMVSVSSGSVSWDVEGNQEASSGYLKIEAAKLGATGIILNSSTQGERQWHSSGSMHQMSGDAIRCID